MSSSLLDLSYHVKQLEVSTRQLAHFEKLHSESSVDLGVIQDSIKTLVITLSNPETARLVLEQQSESTLQSFTSTCFSKLLPLVTSLGALKLTSTVSGGAMAQKRLEENLIFDKF